MRNNKFSPNSSMTRAMLVTVLWRYDGENDEGYSNFSDVAKSQWYAKAVAWASKNGIVNGVGNGKFSPNGNITREQMAAILYRFAGSEGVDTSKRTSLNSFPDGGKVSSYAKDSVQWAVAEGLINGSDGKLMPQGNATRAQVATILMRFIENVVSRETEEPTEPTTPPASKRTYADVIRDAMEERSDSFPYFQNSGTGFLYDIEGNGVEELILIYTAVADNGHAVTDCRVCSIHTMVNGNAVTLVDRIVLSAEAGAPENSAGVISIDGIKYFAAQWSNGGTGVEEYLANGEWYIYSIDGASCNLTTTAQYNVAYYLSEEATINYSKSDAKINGNSISYQEFEAWKNSIAIIKMVSGDPFDTSISLEVLLEQCS